MAGVLLKNGVSRCPLSGKGLLDSLKPTLGRNSSSWCRLKSSVHRPVETLHSVTPMSSQIVPLMKPVMDSRRDFHTGRSLQEIFTVQDEKDFKAKVENSKKPVIVQFHATWCGPCKLLKPRIEKNLAKYADKVDLALVDIDDLPEIAMRHSVGAVPSVMAMKDGKVFNKFVGLKDDDQIDKFLQDASK